MREHRMLRSGPSSEVVRTPLPRREDERQGALDLRPHSPTTDDRIEQLAYENAKLKMQLAQAAALAQASKTYRAYNPVHGWIDKVDAIAAQAAGFAKRLADVKAIRRPAKAFPFIST